MNRQLHFTCDVMMASRMTVYTYRSFFFSIFQRQLKPRWSRESREALELSSIRTGGTTGVIEIHPRLRFSTIVVPRPLAHVLLFFFFSCSLYTCIPSLQRDIMMILDQMALRPPLPSSTIMTHIRPFRLDPWHVTRDLF